MERPIKLNCLVAIILTYAVFNPALAGDVNILTAEFNSNGKNNWSVNVTLKHGDTGWDHYADNWRVVDADNNILGDRVLYHPHVNEQPFTRSLGSVKIPSAIKVVYIEAHDKAHGWTKNRMKVDLSKATKGNLRVDRK